VVANDVQFLDSRSGGGGGGMASEEMPPPPDDPGAGVRDVDPDDIPF
jgi:hypothetical protein